MEKRFACYGCGFEVMAENCPTTCPHCHDSVADLEEPVFEEIGDSS